MGEVARALKGFAASTTAAVVPAPHPNPLPSRGERGLLNATEEAALACVRDGMTFEEAEAAIEKAGVEGFALDLLQDLIEKGALVAEDRDGARRFKR